MITWIGKLCALCAMSTLMQLALPDPDAKGSVRMISGLLMLRLTILTIAEFGAALSGQTDISAIFHSLMS